MIVCFLSSRASASASSSMIDAMDTLLLSGVAVAVAAAAAEGVAGVVVDADAGTGADNEDGAMASLMLG